MESRLRFWTVLALLVLGTAARVAEAVLRSSKVDVFQINQAGTGREVLARQYLKSLQELADSQNGSTVHRFSKHDVFRRSFGTVKAFPGLLRAHLVLREDQRPTRSQHASTIAEVSPGTLLAAWFGGTWERMGDVGIWTARFQEGRWEPPTQVAWPQPSEAYPGWMAPCYNPVLFHYSATNTTILFYKVGVKPSTWRGFILRSADGGLSWGEPEPMAKGLIGPSKNPPMLLDDGTILSPSSDERDEWTCHVEISTDGGRTWSRTHDIHYGRGIIQPTLFQAPDGTVRMFMRPHRDKLMITAESSDGGRTWRDARETGVASPNAGLCAVALADGRVVVVHNLAHRGRTAVAVSASSDYGRTFCQVAVLEDDESKYTRVEECTDHKNRDKADPPEYSYPTVIQSPSDGLLHITYTYSYYGAGGKCSGRENVKHVVIDPCELEGASEAPRRCVLPGSR
uniref:Bnr asp-box repeat domain-containing protein n=1 Tax=Tetraselmis sp. GSL018 TaxID=582737 RepID=A0A061QSV6_9CHLO